MTITTQDSRHDRNDKISLKNRAVSTPVFGLMTSDQVAAALALSKKTLAAWRCSGRSPLPFLRLGSRVRYRSEDVFAWLESRTCSATADTARGQL
jgi:excisionase family DNA binding protein